MKQSLNKIFLILHEHRRIAILCFGFFVSFAGYAQIDVDSRNQEPTRQERYTVREGKKKKKPKRQKSRRTYSNKKQLKRNGDGRAKTPSRFFGGNDIKEKKKVYPTSDESRVRPSHDPYRAKRTASRGAEGSRISRPKQARTIKRKVEGRDVYSNNKQVRRTGSGRLKKPSRIFGGGNVAVKRRPSPSSDESRGRPSYKPKTAKQARTSKRKVEGRDVYSNNKQVRRTGSGRLKKPSRIFGGGNVEVKRRPSPSPDESRGRPSYKPKTAKQARTSKRKVEGKGVYSNNKQIKRKGSGRLKKPSRIFGGGTVEVKRRPSSLSEKSGVKPKYTPKAAKRTTSSKPEGKAVYSNKNKLRKNGSGKLKKPIKYLARDPNRIKKRTPSAPGDRPARPSFNPYQYRKKTTEGQRAKSLSKNVRTASRRGENARTGDISGRKIRTKNTRSERPGQISIPSPYPKRGRSKGTTQVAGRTPRKLDGKRKRTTRSEKGAISSARTAEGGKSRYPSVNPYAGRRKTPEGKRVGKRPKGARSSGQLMSSGSRSKSSRFGNSDTRRQQTTPINPDAGRRKTPEGKKVGKRFKGVRSSSQLMSSGGRTKSNRFGNSDTRRQQTTPINPYAGRRKIQEGKRLKGARSSAQLSSSGRRIKPGRYGNSDSRSKQSTSVNPYAGRKRYSERNRSRFNNRRLNLARSATRRSESEGRNRNLGRNGSISGNIRINRSKNAYAGKDKHFGENSTNKDIAGRRLRTKNTDSVLRLLGGNLRHDPYAGRKKMHEGGRFSKRAMTPFGTNSITRSSESAARRRVNIPLAGYSSTGIKRFGKTIKTRSLSQGGSNRGEKPIFGGYRKARVRSASKSGEKKRVTSSGRMRSISGLVRINRPKNTYANKDRHFGENSTNKDIAGKKLRTRNQESDKPGLQFLGANIRYSAKRKQTVSRAKSLKSKSSAGWNNGGNPILGRSSDSGMGSYSGRIKGFKPFKGGGSITRKWNNGGNPILGRSSDSGMGSYSGRIKGFKPFKGGGSITRKWNNGGNPILGRSSDSGMGSYSGRIKGFKPFKGGGSITRKWNNGGNPILGRSSDSGMGSYSGRIKGFKPFKGGGSITRKWNNGGNPILGRSSDSGMGSYSGRIKGYKPFKGGGSITRKWNNGGNPILGRSSDSGMGSYSGRIKGYKPFKGGGSITRKWNNGGNPILGRSSDSGMGSYSGRIKGYKPFKGGGSITRTWNNGGNPILGRSSDSGMGSYSGRIKGYKPFKGGGSITRTWNNGGNPILGRSSDSGMGSYSGRIKGYKPFKGGGSITRKWNNGGNPILGRSTDSGMGSYSGRIKGYKPFKGGGSITRTWNNGGNPILGRSSDSGMGSYSGKIKGRKPFKGGGSITRTWNNGGNPILGRSSDSGMGSYSGKIKGSKPFKGGGSITRTWNNGGNPILGRSSDSGMGSYSGKIKSYKPFKGGGSVSTEWNNNGMPINKRELYNEEHAKFKGRDKSVQPRSIGRAEGSDYGLHQRLYLFKRGKYAGYMQKYPTKQEEGISAYTLNAKRKTKNNDNLNYGETNWVRSFGNPSSKGRVKEFANYVSKKDLPKSVDRKHRLGQIDGSKHGKKSALAFLNLGSIIQGGLVREYGKARKRLHPSATYTLNNKELNAIEEKEKAFKVRVWWAQLFKKDAGQPEVVKEKTHRPRYSREERNIWEVEEREDWYK